KSRDGVARLDHFAGAVGERDERRRHVDMILAAEHGYVSEVEGCRAHSDDDVARTGFRVGSLDQTQRVDRDGVGEFITAHGFSPCLGWVAIRRDAHFVASKMVREASDGSRTASIETVSK